MQKTANPTPQFEPVHSEKTSSKMVLSGPAETGSEREYVRRIYAETGSKNQTVKAVWGSKNGQTWRWLNEALGDT
jgi:hypothetical protein